MPEELPTRAILWEYEPVLYTVSRMYSQDMVIQYQSFVPAFFYIRACHSVILEVREIDIILIRVQPKYPGSTWGGGEGNDDGSLLLTPNTDTRQSATLTPHLLPVYVHTVPVRTGTYRYRFVPISIAHFKCASTKAATINTTVELTDLDD